MISTRGSKSQLSTAVAVNDMGASDGSISSALQDIIGGVSQVLVAFIRLIVHSFPLQAR